ncbi:O-methyltransferase [Paenibacillus apiarius]|uniref:O-methyltransferase n=1 Tax=Paenibacillus apiarius TaxID=46240 RepID=A0ABT4DWW3_9BACL|nr:O-methyltransferase [Paenibacillus apiarius]MCY9515386.1 O-methyltransferase [Paenibacillus apiarius]MCY9521842.1 O-methyltransferase [Paenibacillus apiarius]MCY9550235.1 O-methyltransferase [Paenibacillus apiarius]MCY9559511.1 O-methyltransferase [Paenibacillus apiarius]MCY9686871.1 O-methyltransferase [Paenibacillus apiarius]
MSNEAVETYLDQLYTKDDTLEHIKGQIRANGMPEISVPAGYGRLLTMLVRMSHARDALEIGALGGYSGCCLLRGLPADGRLVSLELRQDYADLAKRHLTEAGFGEQVEYRIGEALDSLAALEQEGARFDFFFIDADKGNYPNYLEYAIKLARPGAIIAGDNLMLRGRTLDSEKRGPSVLAMRRFNEMIAQDKRLMSTMLPAYDGLALAIVR